MSSRDRSSAGTRSYVSTVMQTISGVALANPTRLCFIVEQKYENDRMPSVVVEVLKSWGHQVDVLRPHSMLADISGMGRTDASSYDAYVLKTVSGGPGLSILEAAGTCGIRTINDHRGIRLARDKAVAARCAQAAGIPFPTTYFASRASLLNQLGRDCYPLVVKPNNGSSCERIFRVDGPDQLDRLDLDDSGFLLAQPYLPNPGYDVKLYNTGEEIYAAVRRSPLHAGEDVVEQLIPVTPELRALAEDVGQVFGLDIYGVDVIETRHGWMVLDVNDFPSFGKVPDVARQLARTVLRLAHRARTQTPGSSLSPSSASPVAMESSE